MFIQNELCALRALEPADADTLYLWENERDLWAYGSTMIPFSKFVLEEFVAAAHQDFYTNRQLRLMIVSPNNEQVYGCLDFFDFEPQHNRCGIGIFVHASYRGKGLATASTKMALDYAFQTLLLKQLFADVNENNSSSLKLFETAGFQKIGLKKAWQRIGRDVYENVWLLQCISPL